MRRVTRNAVVLLVLLAVGLVALGALPGLLESGDAYYVTAQQVTASETPANASTAVTGSTAANGSTASNASAAINATALSERRFPYTTAALRSGTSEPYYRGPWGLKEQFTHSPFDEISALAGRNPTAVADSGVLVRDNGTFYTVAVGQTP